MLERQTNNERVYATDLWTAVESSWTNVEIRNKKEITNKTVNACVVFCPLYEQGDLDKSGIIKQPLGINESRVAGKVTSYLHVIKSVTDNLTVSDQHLKINFVVANKGIMLPIHPNGEDYQAIEYHNDLYKNLVSEFCNENKIDYSFSDFNQHNVNFPTFINLQDPIPEQSKVCTIDKPQEYLIIDYLNNFLDLPEKIENNKTNRHVVKGILHINGVTPEGAFWIIAGYLAFDHKIHTLIGENGIYFVSERIDQLFGISKLTPSLSNLTRIQIKA